MLGKLLKYELRSTSRSFLPLYGMILIVSLANCISLSYNLSGGIMGATLILFSLFVALGVITVVLAINRFYRNLLGDEGYLMNTLPVRVDHLVLSKFFTVLIWIFCSGVTVFLAAFIMMLNSHTRNEFLYVVASILTEMGRYIQGTEASVWLFLFLFFAALVLSVVLTIIQLYFSMSITQLEPFTSHRIPSAIICFVGIQVILSMVMNTVNRLLPVSNFPYSVNEVNIQLAVQIVIYAALSVGFYFGTRYILKNKLNLE